MGEAKQRKAHDANFGRVPKDCGYRGLVVCPPIEITGSRLVVKLSNLDPQELRFALLFWDRLVWPSSRAIHFASNDDELYLESTKILTRPDYTFDGDIAQGVARSQLKAYQDLERAEPGIWALSQGEKSLLLKDGFAIEGGGVLVELHRAIPIPSRDVPLAEILEFRERRRDELLFFRRHLESFVSEIERSDDKTMEFQKRLAELDSASANLLKLGREWQFPMYLSNIKASINLTPTKFLPAVAAGWGLGKTYGLTAASAAAAFGGVASMIEFKADLGVRSVKRPMSPYRYAYQIERELR